MDAKKEKMSKNFKPKFNRKLAPSIHQEEARVAAPLLPTNSLPKPKYLSTSSTPLTNDPSWLQSFVIEGHEGFVKPAKPAEFCVSTDPFLPLVFNGYQLIFLANKSFGNAISLSVYTYYNIMHLCARLLAIERHYGRVHDQERQFLAHF